MRAFFRVFLAFWIVFAALAALAIALAALKSVALAASASLYRALVLLLPGGEGTRSLAWGISLGLVMLPVFAACFAVVLGILRLFKSWPFRPRNSIK